MKITIKTNVHMPEVPREVEMEPGTLKDLLTTIFAGTPVAKEIIDPRTGDIAPEGIFEVSLNGVPHNSLPSGFDTGLRDGDMVTLSLILIGGG